MILIPVHAGFNALHRACKKGELEMVKWLIDVCALSPSIKDNDGTSPIHVAIFHGHHEIVEFLVEYDGSLISCLDERTNCYPLHWAVFKKKSECVLVLLKHGADVLQHDPEFKRNSLHVAIQDRERCKFLLTNS